MNFTKMHERLRMELLRRIQRGSLSVSLLARQTGFGQSHLSNFLHGRRQLSLQAIDQVLAAQRLQPADLLRSPNDTSGAYAGEMESVPVVSGATAMFEPYIRAAATLAVWQAPLEVLQTARPRAAANRRTWQRFVAVVLPGSEARAMHPVILPKATVLIDRHYNSLAPYRTDRPNLYAVRSSGHLFIRYLDFRVNRLVLRPHNADSLVELIELAPLETPADLIVGRVLLILNEV